MASKVTLVGNLTRDPEMKTFGTQQACTFSVAVRTRSKDETGAYKSNFYDCTYFGKMGEYFMNRAQKGTSVVVFGDLSADIYESKSGEKRQALRVTVDSAECVAKMKEGAAPSRGARANDNAIPF